MNRLGFCGPWCRRLAGVVPVLGMLFLLVWGLPAGIFRHHWWLGSLGWIAGGAGVCMYWKYVCRPDPRLWRQVVILFCTWVLILVNVVGFALGYEQLHDQESVHWGIREFLRWGGLAFLAYCIPVSGQLLFLLFEALGQEPEPAPREAPVPLPPLKPWGVPGVTVQAAGLQEPAAPVSVRKVFRNSRLRLIHAVPLIVAPEFGSPAET